MAGYSLGGADLLRRAMGKKIQAAMDEERPKFLAGAAKNGVDKAKALAATKKHFREKGWALRDWGGWVLTGFAN